jgi:hypothetical protein
MVDENDTTNDAPAPAPAGGPAVPAAQPQPSVRPPRRGLPGWAWALIVGGSVLFLVAVVLLVLAATAILGAVSRAEDAATAPQPPVATATASTPDPADTLTPAEAPTAEAPTGADATPGTLITLDEQADLGSAFPIWRYPIQDGWAITTFDQEGINISENAELGCVFTSSQNKQPAQDVTATDDMTDSLATFEVLETRKLNDHPGAELIGELDTAEFAVAYPGGQGSLEFITSRVDYLDQASKVPSTSQIAGRAMPLAESYMYIEVTCPTALVDAGLSPFDDLRDGLEVLFEG